MTERRLFLTLASVLRGAICWISAFWLFTSAETGQAQSIAPIPFLLAAALCALLCYGFLSKPRPLPAVLGLGFALAAAMSAALILLFSPFRTPRPILFGIISVITVVVLSIVTSLKPPTPLSCLSSMELTALFFFLFLWYQAVSDVSAIHCIPLLCAVLLSLLAMLYQRLAFVDSGDRKRSQGLFLGITALFAIALLLVAFIAYGADSMGRWFLLLISAFLSVLKFLAALFDRFLMWLASVSQPVEVDGTLPPPAAAPVLDTIDELPISPVFLVVISSIVLIVILGFILYLLIRFRKLRIGGTVQSASRSRVARQRITLRQWLQQIGLAFTRRFRLLRLLFIARNTPQALYLYLVQSSKTIGLRQHPGETPCAFLLRLADAAADDTALSAALCTLAEVLQERLYARTPSASFSAADARNLRRGFRRFRRTRFLALLPRMWEQFTQRFFRTASPKSAS